MSKLASPNLKQHIPRLTRATTTAGFINSVNPNVVISNGVHRFFQCTYFFGYTSALLLFWGISSISPPPGNRIMETMDANIIQGYAPTDLEVASIDQSKLSDSDRQGKGAATTEIVATEAI